MSYIKKASLFGGGERREDWEQAAPLSGIEGEKTRGGGGEETRVEAAVSKPSLTRSYDFIPDGEIATG